MSKENISLLLKQSARRILPAGEIMLATGAVYPLSPSDIIGFTLQEGADSPLMPGNVLSAAYTLELANEGGRWLPGGESLGYGELMNATVHLRIRVQSGNEWLETPAGVFIVSGVSAPEQKSTITLSGCDSIASELSTVFMDTLAYPCTLSDLWNHAVSQSRYVWKGEIPNGSAVIDRKPDWKENLSLRSAMGYIAAAAGCFVRVNREGALELAKCLGNEAVEIIPDTYMEWNREFDVFGPVDALRIIPERGYYDEAVPITVYAREDGISTGEMLEIEDNPLFMQGAANLSALAKGTLNQLAGLTLRRGEFRWRGDPAIGVGSRVRLTDTRENIHELTVTRQTLSFKNGFSAECSCETPASSDGGVMRAITPEGGVNADALVGTVNGGLLAVGSVTTRALHAGSVTAEKIAAGAVISEKIAAGAVTAEKLSADEIKAFIIEAVQAKIGEIVAGKITSDELFAAILGAVKLSAETGSFTFAEVKNLLANTLFVVQGVGEKVQIANLSVTEANIVSLSVGDLLIRNEDGEMVRIYVDGDGNIQTGDPIADGTLSGAKIIHGSITTAQLNTDEIFASDGVIMNLIANKITSNEALIDDITTNAIGNLSGMLDIYVRKDNLETYLRLMTDGVHVGQSGKSSEVVVTPETVDVRMNGATYSQFASNYVQFGNYQIRRSADGGMVFKMKE